MNLLQQSMQLRCMFDWTSYVESTMTIFLLLVTQVDFCENQFKRHFATLVIQKWYFLLHVHRLILSIPLSRASKHTCFTRKGNNSVFPYDLETASEITRFASWCPRLCSCNDRTLRKAQRTETPPRDHDSGWRRRQTLLLLKVEHFNT